jgi:hypothetical protein
MLRTPGRRRVGLADSVARFTTTDHGRRRGPGESIARSGETAI